MPAISSLRQYLDVLGAEISQNKHPDMNLVRQLLTNISFAAGDHKTPMPDDIFQPGLDDTLMRTALIGLCLMIGNATIKMRQPIPQKP